jgi:MarR family 2-MHQ and catechol resistance regulon transcriptional repressor
VPKSEYKNKMNVDESVMMAIVRTAERFKKESAAIFKNYGLTFPQYNVLRVLDASKNGQNMVRDINRIMLVSGANMTGITKRMEKTGFIIRKSDPNDDRLKWLEITPKGRSVLKDIEEDNERNVKRYLNNCSAEMKMEILSILNDILSLG